jgi:hypothetical protein
MSNLDFLKIADFRSIEFVETLNQREFDGLPSFLYSMCIFNFGPLWDNQTVFENLQYLIGCYGNGLFLRFGQK